MPIYEYVCHSCGKDFEALQKFSDDPLLTCGCGKEGRVERKISLSAFHLHGSGWYKDRYGSSNGKSNTGNSADGNSKGNGGAPSEGKDSGSTKETGAKESGSKAAKDGGKSESKGTGEGGGATASP